MVLASAAADLKYEPVAVSLAYRLGEITLFERRLTGLADRRHFLEQAVITGLPTVPKDGAMSDFYFVPTYPVESPPPTLVRSGEWLYYTPYTFRNYYVDIARLGTFEAYLASFSGKSRSTLRRKVKRFAEANGGGLDWRVMRTPDEMEEFLGLAIPLSEATYQARLLDAGLPTSQQFASDLRERARSGGARGYLLFLSQRPAAYVLCLCRGGIATYDYVGFDPELHALSPGTVLQYLLLEDLFAGVGVSVFDFTEGEGAQKQFFASDFRQCAKTYVLRATAANWVAIRLHIAMNYASAAAGRVLDRWGLKDRIKKLARRTG